MNDPKPVNPSAIVDGLTLFFRPSDVLEIRALDVLEPGQKMAGFFRAGQLGKYAESIAKYAETAGAVYFTPQILRPEILPRIQHIAGLAKVPHGVRLTSDVDVTERRYLIVDIDPIRPTKTCATDSEKSAAWDVSQNVRRYMAEFPFGLPLVVDSGNGYHLYYRLNEPEAGGSVQISNNDKIATVLRILKSKYDTSFACVDGSVFNPARVMKVPGTWSRKGPDTADRPHRICQVQEIPHDWLDRLGRGELRPKCRITGYP